MFKSVMIAAAILISCPALVFSQDIFFLFGGSLPEAGGGPATNSLFFDDTVSSGSVNIYTRSGFNFDAADLNFFSSDASVAQITGGEVFNPMVSFGGIGGDVGGFFGPRFDSAVITAGAGGASANLFAVSVLGINGATIFLPPGNPFFDSTIGPFGSTLLARLDYDIVGTGTAEFSFGLGAQGVLALPATVLDPTFGNATLTSVPEPSSSIALMVGCVAMIARRKKT